MKNKEGFLHEVRIQLLFNRWNIVLCTTNDFVSNSEIDALLIYSENINSAKDLILFLTAFKCKVLNPDCLAEEFREMLPYN